MGCFLYKRKIQHETVRVKSTSNTYFTLTVLYMNTHQGQNYTKFKSKFWCTVGQTTEIVGRNLILRLVREPAPARCVVCVVMLVAVLLFGMYGENTVNQFIYFQF